MELVLFRTGCNGISILIKLVLLEPVNITGFIQRHGSKDGPVGLCTEYNFSVMYTITSTVT